MKNGRVCLLIMVMVGHEGLLSVESMVGYFKNPSDIPYLPMRPLSPTYPGDDIYFPDSPPSSPDTGDTFDAERKRKQEKLSLPLKMVGKIVLSRWGTAAVVARGSGDDKVIVYEGHRMLNSYCPSFNNRPFILKPIFDITFFNENILILGNNGWIRSWNYNLNRVQAFDLVSCTPDIMAVQENGEYAIISATSSACGHRFYFFKPAPKNKITVWPIMRHDRDKIKEAGVVALAPHTKDPRFVVATKAYDAVKLWNIVTNKEEQEFVLPGLSLSIGPSSYKKITALLYYDSCVVGGSSRGDIVQWDFGTGMLVSCRLGCHGDKITSLKYLNDRLYVSGSVDGTVKLWDVRKSTCSLQTMKHGFPVAVISKIYDEETIASGSTNGFVSYWNFQGKQLQKKTGA